MVKRKKRVQPGRGSTTEAESVSVSKARAKATPTKTNKSITSSKSTAPTKKKTGTKVTKKTIRSPKKLPISTKKATAGGTKKEKKTTTSSSKTIASKKTTTKEAKARKKSSPSATKSTSITKTIKKKITTAAKVKTTSTKKAKVQEETQNKSKSNSPPPKECDFLNVDINLDSDTVIIKTINMNDGEEKSITIDLDEPDEIENAANEFKGKYTRSLGMDIWQSERESADLPKLRSLSSIIGTIHPTEELIIYIDGDHDYSQFLRDFIPPIAQSLVPTAEVELRWKCNVPQNEQNVREILQSLPTVKDLKVQYRIEEGNDYSKSKRMMDDNTLSHLVSSCTKYGRLAESHICTAQGVFNVFDTYCSSPDKKFIMFWVHSDIVDELVELAEEKYEVIEGIGQNVLYDESTGKKLIITGCQSEDTRCIVFEVRDDRS